MYSVALLALLAGSQYANVQAASTQFGRRQSDTPVALWGACNFPSEGINGPLPCAAGSECICKDDTYAQCRTQLDGSWTPPGSSWQCQGPGATPGGSTGDSSSPPSTASAPASSSSTTPATGGSGSFMATGNQPGDGSKADAQPVAQKKAGGDAAPADGALANNKLAASAPATVGDCTTVSPPSGYDGAASISYYGWMGSACQCGEAPWQWSGSQGFYHAAVNQKLFGGKINSAGQPNCGSACGQCYELSTSGANTYNNGVAAGSTLTVQIVDACYSAGDHWCGSTSDSYKDSSNCGVHFDIQTGPPGSAGVAPVGSDGKAWNGGGQIVYYTPVACPGSLSSQYQGCTCS